MAKRSTQPKCKMCKRPLRNPKSIADEIGPECAEKYAFLLVGAGLTPDQIGLSSEQLADGEVRRWLDLAERAVILAEQESLKKKPRNVGRFKRDAERFRHSAIAAAQSVIAIPAAA